MFKISYYNRIHERVVEAKYETLEKANDAAKKIFMSTGIIVGIEHV